MFRFGGLCIGRVAWSSSRRTRTAGPMAVSQATSRFRFKCLRYVASTVNHAEDLHRLGFRSVIDQVREYGINAKRFVSQVVANVSKAG